MITAFNRINNKGFTLVELIITITILSTFSIVGYTTFSQFNKNKDLKVAKADFANLLNEAKSDTLSQVDSGACITDSSTFFGYRVVVSASSYTLQRTCRNSSGAVIGTTIKTQTLPSTVILSMNRVTIDSNNNTVLTPATTISFSVPNATTGASYSAVLTGNTSLIVGVDQNGVILQ